MDLVPCSDDSTRSVICLFVCLFVPFSEDLVPGCLFVCLCLVPFAEDWVPLCFFVCLFGFFFGRGGCLFVFCYPAVYSQYATSSVCLFVWLISVPYSEDSTRSVIFLFVCSLQWRLGTLSSVCLFVFGTLKCIVSTLRHLFVYCLILDCFGALFFYFT